MNEILRMLQRQAEWQTSRNALSWPEKLRLVEQIRDSILLLRQSKDALSGPASLTKMK